MGSGVLDKNVRPLLLAYEVYLKHLLTTNRTRGAAVARLIPVNWSFQKVIRSNRVEFNPQFLHFFLAPHLST